MLPHQETSPSAVVVKSLGDDACLDGESVVVLLKSATMNWSMMLVATPCNVRWGDRCGFLVVIALTFRSRSRLFRIRAVSSCFEAMKVS